MKDFIVRLLKWVSILVKWNMSGCFIVCMRAPSTPQSTECGNSLLENCLVAFKWLRLQYNDFKRYIESSAIQITPTPNSTTIIIICSFTEGPLKLNHFEMFFQQQNYLHS